VQKKIKGRESKARQQTHVCHKTANMGHLLGLRFVVREFRSKSKSKSKSNSKSKSKSNSKSKSKSKSKSNSNSKGKYRGLSTASREKLRDFGRDDTSVVAAKRVSGLGWLVSCIAHGTVDGECGSGGGVSQMEQIGPGNKD
jgi:hypothetical protein